MNNIGKIFALVFVLAGSIAAMGQEFTLSVTSDLVLLDIGVRNPKGGYVAGLLQNRFHVYENGKLQAISHFSSEDVPVTVGLVIDTSGSMGPKYQQVVTAALVFIAASNPNDEVFVVNFNDGVTLGLPPSVPFTDDIGKLREALSMGKPEGRTALYDAMTLALNHLEKGKRDKKTLVLISDGGDNHSSHKLSDVMRMVQESRATIYTIGIFDEDDQDRNPDVLRQLSKVSGGETFLPKEASEVVGICRQVANDIRVRYTIGYVPAQNMADDRHALRKIRVAASQLDGKSLIVHTRTSYLVPRP
jgi:Ca-activated chloride channel family protein